MTDEERARGWLEDRPTLMHRLRDEHEFKALTGAIADLLAAVRADERERCARLVEGWHIKRGGYLNLATAIRAGTP